MKIHTVSRGETLCEIAERHGVSKKILSSFYGVKENTPLLSGEELLIPSPTRTYTAKASDTVERIALRFGVRRRELLTQNPHIGKCGVKEGDELILRTADTPLSTAASAGILYRSASEESLYRALPYLTYVAISSFVAGDCGARRIFDERRTMRIINENGKIPLLRITDTSGKEKYTDKKRREDFISELVALASGEGYKGVMLAVPGAVRDGCDCFAEFLVELRRKMIGEDLILITECDEKSPIYLSELSDGAVFSIERCGDCALGFDTFEKAKITAFASEGESSKSFLDLSPFASVGGEYITIDEAMKLARRGYCEIKTDEESLMSSFEYKGKSVRFPSLKNIKARLELSAELGFMGISFDIMRVPTTHLSLLGACFRNVSYAGFNSPGGCRCEP